MGKPRKVKRYSIIYNQKRRRRQMFLRILLGVVGFLLIVGAVFLIAMGLFGGVEDDSSATPPQPTPAVSEEIPSETDSQQEQPRSDSAIVAKELPVNYVGSPSKIADFATTAKEEGYTAIVVPLKTEKGEILYDSKVPEATSWGAISSSTTDVDKVVTAIEDAGLMPIAELYAFEDDIASYAKRGNSYYYGTQTTTTRLFGSGDGVSWLNPYQKSARDYICDLAQELYQLGFQTIWLNGVQFPPQGLDSKTGTNANGVSQEEILKTFIQEMNAIGVPFVISYEWNAVGGGGDAQTLYGGDPTTYGVPELSPVLDSSVSAQQLTATLQQTMSQAPEAVIIPSIPATADLTQMTAVLQEAGVNSYLLLSE